MREGPSSQLLAGAAGWRPRVRSRRDGAVLAEDVPVASGRLVVVADAEVPERLEVTVPAYRRGVSWVPDGPDHPLARYGQHLEALIEVTAPVSGMVTQTRLGLFRVHSWEHDDAGAVRVTALGQLQRAKTARFRAPEVPRKGGSFFSEFRRLMPAGISVQIDPSLVDRPIPQSFVWETERLAALYEIADALPARMRVDQWGQVRLLPPLADVPSPVLTLTDGQGGTVMTVPRSDTSEQAYNVVVATSSATDSPAREPVSAVAVETSGPMAVRSDGSGYGEAVRYVSSPLITTKAQALAMAQTELAKEQRRTTIRSVRCAPDPRVDLDDAVALHRAGEVDWGYVVGYELPLTIHDGPMRIDVGVTH